MACNSNNGKTFIDFLTAVPGGTAEDATYQLSLTHFLCGNRKLCINEAFPLSADLKFTPIGTPRSVGNESYCCDVACTGTCTYMPYTNNGCGCQCGQCPRTENIYTTLSVPCSSAATPTITAGEVQCSPTNVQSCCNVTNAIALTTSFKVATAEAETASTTNAKRKV